MKTVDFEAMPCCLGQDSQSISKSKITQLITSIMSSTKKRSSEQAALSAAAPPKVDPPVSGFSSANIEDKPDTRDLGELAGVVLAVRGPGEVTDVKMKKGGQFKPVFKGHANDANHDYVVIEAWGNSASVTLGDWFM